jgi:hypothetical protein
MTRTLPSAILCYLSFFLSSQDAIRGATYDLLSSNHWEGFRHLPQHAFATLGDHDRVAIRSKLLGTA